MVIIRPANVYGFGHFRGGSGGGRLLQDIVTAGIAGRAAKITAAQARSFEYIHSSDLGKAMYCAAIRDVTGPFNAGNGTIVNFEELSEAIRSAIPDLNVKVGRGERPSFKQPMDLTKSKEFLGWQPAITLAEGFQKYVTEVRAANVEI